MSPNALCNPLAIVRLHRMPIRVAGLSVALNMICGQLPASDTPRLSDILSQRGAFRPIDTGDGKNPHKACDTAPLYSGACRSRFGEDTSLVQPLLCSRDSWPMRL
jgi:hypothetical protein